MSISGKKRGPRRERKKPRAEFMALLDSLPKFQPDNKYNGYIVPQEYIDCRDEVLELLTMLRTRNMRKPFSMKLSEECTDNLTVFMRWEKHNIESNTGMMNLHIIREERQVVNQKVSSSMQVKSNEVITDRRTYGELSVDDTLRFFKYVEDFLKAYTQYVLEDQKLIQGAQAYNERY